MLSLLPPLLPSLLASPLLLLLLLRGMLMIVMDGFLVVDVKGCENHAQPPPCVSPNTSVLVRNLPFPNLSDCGVGLEVKDLRKQTTRKFTPE